MELLRRTFLIGESVGLKHIARSYKLPDNLRRERLVLEPEGIDFNEVTKVSDEVTEVLMYTPGEFWVKQIVRPKYKAKKETQDLRTIFYQHPTPHLYTSVKPSFQRH